MPATLLKKRPWHSCFPVNFVKFLRTTFLQNKVIKRNNPDNNPALVRSMELTH